MHYEMTPKDFMEQTIKLYIGARKAKFEHVDVHRGRSHSISGDLEDLLALFIARNNPNLRSYFTDQPLKFGNKTRYPDIVIQDEHGCIRNLIDVKADTGWMRNDLYNFCNKWESYIEDVKGSQTTFKLGENKEPRKGEFSTDLKYHVVIVSKKNSGKKLDEDYNRVKAELRNVKVYILSRGVHPNKYGSDPNELLSNIKIEQEEFDRLMGAIIHK